MVSPWKKKSAAVIEATTDDPDVEVAQLPNDEEEDAVAHEEETGGVPRADAKKKARRKMSLFSVLGRRSSKTGKESFKEVLDIGGETVYIYLQREYVYWDGIVAAILAVTVQLVCFWVFFIEAYRCGIIDSDDCTLEGGLLASSTSGNSTSFTISSEASPIGIGCGLAIAIVFLAPDFMKGIVFLKRGYPIVGLVHIVISIAGIISSILYTATTSISDVSILTNMVVLIFVTDLDERTFDLHAYTRDFFLNKFITDF